MSSSRANELQERIESKLNEAAEALESAAKNARSSDDIGFALEDARAAVRALERAADSQLRLDNLPIG